jgi:AraC family transcriptional activator of pobA
MRSRSGHNKKRGRLLLTRDGLFFYYLSLMQKIPVRHLKSPGSPGNFSIRALQPLLSGQDLIQPLHRHSFFHILALEKGAGEHSLDFINYPVSGHTVFFMRPGQAHQLVLKKGSTGYLLEFTREFYTPANKAAIETLRRVSHKPQCPLDNQRFNRLFSILREMMQEYTAKEDQFHDAIRSQLDIFFIQLLRQSRNPQNSENNEYQQQRLEELQEWIEQNIAAQKQPAWYAAKMNLSAYQLNAITKATLGKTVSELIIDSIILEARRHLLATSNQVSQVADVLGYEDVSYFIRFFKKHTGHTPESYRQNFK